MTDHDHSDHDHSDHEQSVGEHHHTYDWQAELEQVRHAARHYYEHQFDWHGHGPPEGFDGPRFYPPAPELRLRARLDTAAPGTGDHVQIATSTGKVREQVVAGQLVFEIEGAEHRLTGFLTADAQGYEVIFVPFRDATSGNETYGAGRYVEVPVDPESDALELDFNYAYNPSCVYSPAYDCPFPPPTNLLSVPIRAGEMMPLVKA